MKTRIIFSLLLITGLIFSSCVKDEVFEGPPSLSELAMSPQAPRDVDIVNVSVKATDLNGLKGVKLYYNVDAGAYTTVDMAVTGGQANTYSGMIPAQPAGKTVTYYVEAENESGQKAWLPDGAPETTSTYTIGAPSITMNEIYSRGTVEDPDWIEIYNNSDIQADISGFTIYDSGGQTGAKPKKSIPAGTIIEAHGFFVIVVDDAEESGFGLSGSGEEVWLESASGSIADNVVFPAFEENQSYGRIPDGSGSWVILDQITRGSVNDNSPPAPVILINEVYSTGTTENPDWVEIYNGSATQTDISGYKIYDSGGQAGTKDKKVFPAGSVIPAGGFLVIVVDDAEASGFGLSGNGEQIWLENASGTLIDDVTFPALIENQSFGRFPDGSIDLQVMNTVTRGAANSNVDPEPTIIILMNEIFSKGVDPDLDWVEIYNGSTVEVNISGYKIYDSGGQSGVKPKKEFPAGTVIPAGGFFVIVTDDAEESGFGLSSGGEQIWLDDAAGAIIDDVTFPAMIDGQSYGRKPDGSAGFFIFTEITRGASNNNAATLP
jgi:hypothetical protein